MRSSMLDENGNSFENKQVTPTFVEHKQIEKIDGLRVIQPQIA